MDNRNEIRQFLTSRRARITPEQAGLPTRMRREHYVTVPAVPAHRPGESVLTSGTALADAPGLC